MHGTDHRARTRGVHDRERLAPRGSPAQARILNMKRSRRSLFAPVLAVPAPVAPALVALALVALALAAPALGAQRGGHPPVPPAQQPPRPGDTTLVRRTPDGFVLDFQNVDINVVLAAIAEAGG